MRGTQLSGGAQTQARAVANKLDAMRVGDRQTLTASEDSGSARIVFVLFIFWIEIRSILTSFTTIAHVPRK